MFRIVSGDKVVYSEKYYKYRSSNEPANPEIFTVKGMGTGLEGEELALLSEGWWIKADLIRKFDV